MMKRGNVPVLLLFALIFSFCQHRQEKSSKMEFTMNDSIDISAEKQKISVMLDSFNLAAARGDFAKYFGFFTEDAVFIGTDAIENWDKESFMIWSKPYFERGKAWDFTSIARNIYFNQHRDIAWFDELLDSQMKICRGSGVVVKQGNLWKIQQYVLSMTVPNSEIDKVVELKSAIDDELIREMKKR